MIYSFWISGKWKSVCPTAKERWKQIELLIGYHESNKMFIVLNWLSDKMTKQLNLCVDPNSDELQPHRSKWEQMNFMYSDTFSGSCGLLLNFFSSLFRLSLNIHFLRNRELVFSWSCIFWLFVPNFISFG